MNINGEQLKFECNSDLASYLIETKINNKEVILQVRSGFTTTPYGLYGLIYIEEFEGFPWLRRHSSTNLWNARTDRFKPSILTIILRIRSL